MTLDTLTIALDAMGGDHAPACAVDGAACALEKHPHLQFVLFGNEARIRPLLSKHVNLGKHVEIVHTDRSIAAEEKPSNALRQGKQSSMRLAIDAVKDGKAQAIVSAGNTGALMAMSKLVLRTLPGIARPAICTLLPTKRSACVMLDLGADIESDAESLVQFAIMGDAYARVMLGLQQPSIGLLNVGSEEMKGHEELREAHAQLKALSHTLSFHGFIEGNDITEGKVDVVVTDGFSGNIALKTAEGTARMISYFIQAAFRHSMFAKVGYLFAKGAIGDLKKKLDPRKYNGAMFVGLNGIVVKSHGNADAYGYAQAIAVAAALAQQGINERITEEVRLSSAAARPQEATV